ncbi:proton-coupled folate transporter-like [Glossina fuscipes]|uniref:Proton-coupled folate transporter-like n=1 Tax=Glossina fuscipes TaxID=7396 RepID=A0A9C5YY82_9MUSC|nr:proton-coupled folate transporter-like [Glossina fuscipes]
MDSDTERLYDSSLENEEQIIVNNDAVSVATNSDGARSFPESSISIKRNKLFILEPAVFLVFLAFNLSGAVFQNILLYQTCVYVYKYNISDCQPLLGVQRESAEVQHIETQIQPYVVRILMAISLLESIIPAIVSLFIGPWSDKYGRRPILLTTFSGYLISRIIATVLIYISSKVVINPWLFLLCSVPSVMSGGTCALITGIYCYISDVAKAKSRALRMVLNEASLCAGMMIGNVLTGYIYEATNAFTVFSISSTLLFLALLYVYAFVVESLKPEQIMAAGNSKIREFFRLDLVKDLVQTCTKRRPNYDRIIIWLTMMALTLALFVMAGDDNVSYLFVRNQFQWTLKDYTVFNATRIIVQIMGSIIGMYFLRKMFQFSIVGMTLISLASCVFESTVRATAIYWWELYLGLTLGLMRGVMGPMSRAILSHVAPATEVGKIYALTTSLESLSPLISSPLYTIVYNATLSLYPGAFNFLSAGLYLLCYTFIAIIYGIQKSMGENATYQAIGR